MFLEKYQIQTPIVRYRGTCIVYRGRDMQAGRDVAIKVLRDSYRDDPHIVARFERKGRAVLALHSPYVIEVYDYVATEGTHALIMELVQGTALRRSPQVAIEQVRDIARQVALGLHVLHEQAIIHTRINPDHVLLGDNGQVKITPMSLTWGPPGYYYAPEQLRNEAITPATDIYALGILMYKLLTGRTPFEGDNPAAVAMRHFHEAPVPPGQLNPGITPPLEKIILRCLEKAPEMRYQDGMQLAHALETLREA